MKTTTTTQVLGTRRFDRPDDLLAGRCFLIIDPDGAIQYQGFIWGRVEPGFYLIQYFEAFMGEPNDLRVAALEEVMGWRLEADDEALRHAMEYGFVGVRNQRAIQARQAKAARITD